jgi:hypothetical protein
MTREPSFAQVAAHLQHLLGRGSATVSMEELAARLSTLGLITLVQLGEGGAAATSAADVAASSPAAGAGVAAGAGAGGMPPRSCLRTLRHSYLVCLGFCAHPGSEPVLLRWVQAAGTLPCPARRSASTCVVLGQGMQAVACAFRGWGMVVACPLV